MTAHRVLALACSVLAAGLLAAAPAAADSSTNLTLSVQGSSGPAQVATLTCEPAGGKHPKAADACKALVAVDGDVRRMTNDEMACTMEFAPVAATLKGTWRGQPVAYAQDFGNPCALRSRTGPIFAL
ncbi:hypothetical protein JOF53_003898 [Crossiella equi]|uniref:Subtilisin inhibitor domain-containing protein n=1 Tax=Crossiella equi TaxID=130796 RepID=A0ABS5AFC0_9PSEU|nr:SSI family serine proteinase inhibitor [Crossiella equi]MBP2475026.1 hypothetical protein [Crossiella equi]